MMAVGRTTPDLSPQPLKILIVKGQKATKHGVEADTQAPHVTTGSVVAVALDHLRLGQDGGVSEGIHYQESPVQTQARQGTT
jgi:hypothetical protein